MAIGWETEIHYENRVREREKRRLNGVLEIIDRCQEGNVKCAKTKQNQVKISERIECLCLYNKSEVK